MRPFVFLTALALSGLCLAGPAEAQYPYAQPINSLVPVYRMFNGQNGDHLYSSDLNEVNIIPAQGYYYEGVAFDVSRVPGAGMVPLYRFFLPNGAHALSTSPQAPSLGYVPAEAVEGYIWAGPRPGLLALYQWYNPNLGVFLYTTDPRGEAAPASGFFYQGALGYVAPATP